MVAVSAIAACGTAAGASAVVPATGVAAPEWLLGPLPAVGGAMSPGVFGLLVVAMFGLYLVLLACVDDMRPAAVAGTIVAVAAIFALAPPLLSRDVFSYIDYARLGALHGLDPYLNAPFVAPGDPVYPWVSWNAVTTVYGPLFTAASYGLGPLGVAGALWTLKGVTLAAVLGCAALLWRGGVLAGRSPARSAALFGLNPVVTVHVVGGAHNDALLLLFVTAALVLAVGRRESAAGAAFVAAGAVKAAALLGLPFLVLGAVRRRAALAGAVAGALAVAVLALVVFGAHALDPAPMLRAQREFVSAHSIPNEIGRVLGQGGLTPSLRTAATAAFLVSAVYLLYRVRRGMPWAAAAGCATVALLFTTAWLMPWYAAWALPFAALAGNRRLTAAALTLSLLVIVLRLPLTL